MYCTNCGQQLDENGVCPNCGKSVSSTIQQNRLTPTTLKKRSNLFPILYIVSVVIFVIEAFMRINEGQDLLNSDVEAYVSRVQVNFYPLKISIVLSGILLLTCSIFLITRKDIRWSAILMPVAYLFLTFYNISFIKDGLNGGNSKAATIVLITMSVFIFNLIMAGPILMLIASFKANTKKGFTKFLIISFIIAFLPTNILGAFPILFMGLSIRNDFDLLLLEREQKKSK